MQELTKFAADEQAIIDRAHKLAKTFHVAQKRKYNGEPYYNHVERVALEVWNHGGSAFQVAAGYGHDLLEDTNITHQQLFDSVGPLAYQYILWLTNPSKQIPGSKREVRKLLDASWLKQAPKEVKIIKLIDRIDNVRDMHGADDDFKKKYCQESSVLAVALFDADEFLYKELVTAINHLMQTVKTGL